MVLDSHGLAPQDIPPQKKSQNQHKTKPWSPGKQWNDHPGGELAHGQDTLRS